MPSLDCGKELIANGRSRDDSIEHCYRVYKLLTGKSTMLNDYLSCVSLPYGIDRAAIHICDESEYEDHDGCIHILSPQLIRFHHGFDDRDGMLFADGILIAEDILKVHGNEIIKYAVKVSHTIFDGSQQHFTDLIFVLED